VHLPTRIGKYELLQFLGGGMSEVYRARDMNLGRTVAFKILTEAGLADETAKSRMQEEARVAGGLIHENVIAFYDYGEVSGRPFLVTEYFEGETLREALRGGRAGDLQRRLLIARKVANALAYVHSKRIIHRDVKPDNIRVDTSGNIKLMDFGVAKSGDLSLTASGFTVGTPYYMAPEQIRGAKPTHLVDVYAFGVVLFELITETRPFEAPTPSEIFDLILSRPLDTRPLVRLGVPSSLVDLVRAATDKDPAQRPQEFSIVVQQIDEVLAALAARNSGRKVRWFLIGLLAVLLAIGLYALLRCQR
jgi:serine/threonine protein kinase